MPPTQIGVLVGCALPPAGSSVTARALVCAITSGGLSTIIPIFPWASGANVCEGIGFPPGAFGINHN